MSLQTDVALTFESVVKASGVSIGILFDYATDL